MDRFGPRRGPTPIEALVASIAKNGLQPRPQGSAVPGPMAPPPGMGNRIVRTPLPAPDPMITQLPHVGSGPDIPTVQRPMPSGGRPGGPVRRPEPRNTAPVEPVAPPEPPSQYGGIDHPLSGIPVIGGALDWGRDKLRQAPIIGPVATVGDEFLLEGMLLGGYMESWKGGVGDSVYHRLIGQDNLFDTVTNVTDPKKLLAHATVDGLSDEQKAAIVNAYENGMQTDDGREFGPGGNAAWEQLTVYRPGILRFFDELVLDPNNAFGPVGKVGKAVKGVGTAVKAEELLSTASRLEAAQKLASTAAEEAAQKAAAEGAEKAVRDSLGPVASSTPMGQNQIRAATEAALRNNADAARKAGQRAAVFVTERPNQNVMRVAKAAEMLGTGVERTAHFGDTILDLGISPALGFAGKKVAATAAGQKAKEFFSPSARSEARNVTNMATSIWSSLGNQAGRWAPLPVDPATGAEVPRLRIANPRDRQVVDAVEARLWEEQNAGGRWAGEPSSGRYVEQANGTFRFKASDPLVVQTWERAKGADNLDNALAEFDDLGRSRYGRREDAIRLTSRGESYRKGAQGNGWREIDKAKQDFRAAWRQEKEGVSIEDQIAEAEFEAEAAREAAQLAREEAATARRDAAAAQRADRAERERAQREAERAQREADRREREARDAQARADLARSREAARQTQFDEEDQFAQDALDEGLATQAEIESRFRVPASRARRIRATMERLNGGPVARTRTGGRAAAGATTEEMDLTATSAAETTPADGGVTPAETTPAATGDTVSEADAAPADVAEPRLRRGTARGNDYNPVNQRDVHPAPVSGRWTSENTAPLANSGQIGSIAMLERADDYIRAANDSGYESFATQLTDNYAAEKRAMMAPALPTDERGAPVLMASNLPNRTDVEPGAWNDVRYDDDMRYNRMAIMDVRHEVELASMLPAGLSPISLRNTRRHLNNYGRSLSDAVFTEDPTNIIARRGRQTLYGAKQTAESQFAREVNNIWSNRRKAAEARAAGNIEAASRFRMDEQVSIKLAARAREKVLMYQNAIDLIPELRGDLGLDPGVTSRLDDLTHPSNRNLAIENWSPDGFVRAANADEAALTAKAALGKSALRSNGDVVIPANIHEDRARQVRGMLQEAGFVESIDENGRLIMQHPERDSRVLTEEPTTAAAAAETPAAETVAPTAADPVTESPAADPWNDAVLPRAEQLINGTDGWRNLPVESVNGVVSAARQQGVAPERAVRMLDGLRAADLEEEDSRILGEVLSSSASARTQGVQERLEIIGDLEAQRLRLQSQADAAADADKPRFWRERADVENTMDSQIDSLSRYIRGEEDDASEVSLRFIASPDPRVKAIVDAIYPTASLVRRRIREHGARMATDRAAGIAARTAQDRAVADVSGEIGTAIRGADTMTGYSDILADEDRAFLDQQFANNASYAGMTYGDVLDAVEGEAIGDRTMLDALREAPATPETGKQIENIVGKWDRYGVDILSDEAGWSQRAAMKKFEAEIRKEMGVEPPSRIGRAFDTLNRYYAQVGLFNPAVIVRFIANNASGNAIQVGLAELGSGNGINVISELYSPEGLASMYRYAQKGADITNSSYGQLISKSGRGGLNPRLVNGTMLDALTGNERKAIMRAAGKSRPAWIGENPLSKGANSYMTWARNVNNAIDYSARTGYHGFHFRINLASMREEFPSQIMDIAPRMGMNETDVYATLRMLPEITDAETVGKAMEKVALLRGAAADDASGFGRETARRWANATKKADDMALAKVDKTLFSINATKADEMIHRVLPYHFWMSRALPFYAEQFLRHPAVAVAYFKSAEAMQQQSEAEGMPAWASTLMKVYSGPMGMVLANDPMATFGLIDVVVNDSGGYTPENMTWLGSLVEKARGVGFGPYAYMAGALNFAGYMGDGTYDLTNFFGLHQASKKIGAVVNWMAGEGLLSADHGNYISPHFSQLATDLRQKTSGILPGSQKIYAKDMAAGPRQQMQLLALKRLLAMDDLTVEDFMKIHMEALNDPYGEAAQQEDEYLTAVWNAESDDSPLWRDAVRDWSRQNVAGEAVSMTGFWQRFDSDRLFMDSVISASMGERTSIPGLGVLPQMDPYAEQAITANEKAFMARWKQVFGDDYERGDLRELMDSSYSFKDLTTATPQAAPLILADQQYRSIGGKKYRTAMEFYGKIIDGEVDAVKTSSGLYRSGELARMDQDQRRDVAQEWLESQPNARHLDRIRQVREVYRDTNPEYNQFSQWRYDVGKQWGSMTAFRTAAVRTNPNYKRAVDEQTRKAISSGLTPAQVEDRLDQWSNSIDAYFAYRGIQRNKNDMKPLSVGTDPLPAASAGAPVGAMSGGGSGSSGSSGKSNSTWVNDTIMETHAAVMKINRQMQQAGWGPNFDLRTMRSSFANDAMMEQIKATLPQDNWLYFDYLEWAAVVHAEGGNTSIAAYAKWRDAQQNGGQPTQDSEPAREYASPAWWGG